MRHLRSLPLSGVLLLVAAAGVLRGETLISLGASSANSSTCALSGGGVCNLTARVTGLPSAAVTFDFSPTVAGAVIGVPTGPDNTGLTRITYTAPLLIAARQTVIVTATAADGTKATQIITLVPPAVTVQVTPSSTVILTAGQTQRFTATVHGVSQGGVTWTASSQVGSVVINGNTLDYTAPNPITSTVTITFTATSTFDPTVSGTGRVQLNAPSITISPTTASLTNSQKQQFTATVNGLSSSAVTWSINPLVGSIDQTGLYTAPGFLSATTRVTVTAASVVEPARTASAAVVLTPTSSVGAGAPTETITNAFMGGFNRDGFNSLVTLPPVANVRAFGGTGYVQEFIDAENSGLRHALVTASASRGGTNAIYQIRGPLWAYYSSVGANTAGYPLSDSMTCAALGVGCVWDTFDRGYALFAYKETLPNGAGPNFMLNGAFYTEWNALGGMSLVGPPITAQTSVTAALVPPATAATTATFQTFAQGSVYSISSGPNRGRIFGVLGQLYDLYVTQGGPGGALGLPTSEAYQVSGGLYRQNFEGGVLQYGGGGDPSVLLPIVSVQLSGAKEGSTITLSVGQTLTLNATPFLAAGVAATDRPVSWSTTNGKVVSIQASGGAAVVTAIGAGAASVQAASQGVSSARINFVVVSPCCRVGEGAPAGVRQAFQDALTRNKIAVQEPLPAPAERVGSGYVQLTPSADGKANYLLTLSDRLGAAYVVAGSLLARYQGLGGPAGPLGYPASDASAGGTQLFAGSAALGGNPVRTVAGHILSKWALLGYENGAAGFPVSDAASFSTIGANTGVRQSFSRGVIYAATAGPRSGQAYFVGGVILTRYEMLGGASGDFGMPTSDEFVTGALHQQNFEGGNLSYLNGDSAAVEHAAPRTPAVIASPSSVSAGGRARIAILGFPNDSALRVSVAGSPDFAVTAANGSYAWEVAVPLSARSGMVAIRAVDGKGASAEGSYTVKGFADNRIQITKAQGDNQTGLPGSVLPVPLRVALVDSANAPVSGVPVTFEASSGVQLSSVSAVSDGAGHAEVIVRLPQSAGLAAVKVAAGAFAQTPVTFYARAAADTLANVPKMTQAGDIALGNGSATIAQKGALLASVAAILRYHQNRGELRAPNGPADPAQLNEFLRQYCTVDTRGAQVCDGFVSAGSGAEQVVNLWRAAEFTGGVDVVVRPAAVSSAMDALAEGSPALLSLALMRNGSLAGGHFVVATGVGEDGSLVIQDPNPAFGRSSLNDYLRGFTTAGAAWTGELRGVVQLALRTPAPTRLLLAALSQSPELIKQLAMEVQSAAGSCGVPLDLFDAVDGGGNPAAGFLSRMRACEGSESAYQLAVGAAQPYKMWLADLATAGSTVDLSGTSPATYKATRNRLNLVVTPQEASFSADAVVNAATFSPGIAPGGIMSIFGAGLSGAGGATAVEVDGQPAAVLSASPFQINAVVPAGVAPGTRTLEVRSAFGVARQAVTVSDVAPAIFLVGSPAVGAVVNEDWSLNGPGAPIGRGRYLMIYSTGLGATTGEAGLSRAVEPVTVVLNGIELPAAYAGLQGQYPGLYQVNVVLPLSVPPGLGIGLALKQGGHLSNVVPVAVQ